jgi:hyperosmotically inducible protein
MRPRYLVSAVLLLVLATAVSAQENTLLLFRRVQNQVLGYQHFSVFDSVNAAINDGVVTLTGKVTMPFKRDDIGERVSKVSGVKKVDNRIEVLPASKSDDELRVGIANAIYGNPAFANYSIQANPPIHIIVERGRVTLEGVVTNDVDRTLAYSIASSFQAFAVKNDLRTDKEARAELQKR